MSFRTIAAARQKEMKASIAVVATTTCVVPARPSGDEIRV